MSASVPGVPHLPHLPHLLHLLHLLPPQHRRPAQQPAQTPSPALA
jgi:hypothetical protein